jgi:beta-galactosidase
VSGKVDAVRLPKEIYYAHRVMQNEQPDLHILGHWSYPLEQPATPEEPAVPGRPPAPGRPPLPDQPAIPAQPAHKTVKTVYVVANTESVELILNGKSLGVNAKPENGYVFAFPEVAFVPGSLKAVGRNGGKVVAGQELTTAGEPAAIKLTSTVGPRGLRGRWAGRRVHRRSRWWMQRGSAARRTMQGSTLPSLARASGAAAITAARSIDQQSVSEYRMRYQPRFVRSTLVPGTMTITASREGLKPAKIQIVSKAVNLADGLSNLAPQLLRGPAEG